MVDVLWRPPPAGTVKVNIHGSVVGSPSAASIGGVFRGLNAAFLGSFVQNIGIATAFTAELTAAMYAIEKAFDENWHDLWLESDSKQVILGLNGGTGVPWLLRNRWSNCMGKFRSLNGTCSHIFREGNSVADALAKNALLFCLL